jgi:hypothetical protein
MTLPDDYSCRFFNPARLVALLTCNLPDIHGPWGRRRSQGPRYTTIQNNIFRFDKYRSRQSLFQSSCATFYAVWLIIATTDIFY